MSDLSPRIEVQLAHFIDKHGLNEFIIPAMQTYGIVTAMAAAPYPINPSEWINILWGELDSPFKALSDFEEYANLIAQMWNECKQALLTNEWKWPESCQLSDDEIVNLNTRNLCEGLLQGWKLTNEDWQIIMPTHSENRHLMEGVILSISLLYDPETAMTALAEEGLANTDQFTEIFNALPMMLSGIAMKAAEIVAEDEDE